MIAERATIDSRQTQTRLSVGQCDAQRTHGRGLDARLVRGERLSRRDEVGRGGGMQRLLLAHRGVGETVQVPSALEVLEAVRKSMEADANETRAVNRQVNRQEELCK